MVEDGFGDVVLGVGGGDGHFTTGDLVGLGGRVGLLRLAVSWPIRSIPAGVGLQTNVLVTLQIDSYSVLTNIVPAHMKLFNRSSE